MPSTDNNNSAQETAASLTQMGVHETLELHELLTFKSLCLTKSTAMQALAAEPTLKGLLEQDVQMSQRQVQELQSLVSDIKLH